MSLPNLVEVKDVKGVYSDLPNSINAAVKNYISIATMDTYQDANINETPTDENILHNLKLACCYKILMWLESTGKIESSSNEISSMKDAGFSVSFKQSASGNNQPKSYSENYVYYLNKLKGRPPIGGSSRRGWG